MIDWLSRKKWLVAKAALACLVVLLAGLNPRVADKESRPDGISLWPGSEKVITLGDVSQAAGTVDYVLDGTDDNVQIQAALNTLPAAGGRIVLVSAMQINFAALATVTRAIDNVVIEGSGRGTYLVGDGVTALFTAGGNNWHFKNLRTDAAGINMVATTGWTWENVTVNATCYGYRSSSDLTGSSWAVPTGRGATIVVAANDASPADKAQADYICDGTSDETDINAAITAASGGIVSLSKGTFTIDGRIIPITNTWVKGSGPGTIVKLINALPDPGADFGMIEATGAAKSCIAVSDLTLDGNSATQGAFSLHGIYYSQVSQWSVTNVVFKDILVHSMKPYSGCPYGILADCLFQNVGMAVYLDNTSDHTALLNSTVDGASYGILVDNTFDFLISGWTIDMSGMGSYSGGAVEVSRGSADGRISSMSLQGPGGNVNGVSLNAQAANLYGIKVDGVTARGFVNGFIITAGDAWESSYHSFTDCTATSNQQHGFYLTGLAGGTHNNTLSDCDAYSNSQEGDNTYDNIRVEGNSDYNNISGGTVRMGGAANDPKYGVNVAAATCDGNSVCAVDLYTAGQTANFNDAGTGTVYGDNPHVNPFICDMGEYIQIGTYVSGLPALSAQTFDPATGNIFANLVWVPRDMTIDKVGFRVTGAAGAGGEARVGIYSTTSVSDLSPGTLFNDCGTIATDGAGLKEVAVTLTLKRGYYWFAITHNNVAPVATCQCANVAWSPMGTHSDGYFNPTFYIDEAYATLAYGALPATFPAAGFGYYYRRGNLVLPRVASLLG